MPPVAGPPSEIGVHQRRVQHKTHRVGDEAAGRERAMAALVGQNPEPRQGDAGKIGKDEVAQKDADAIVVAKYVRDPVLEVEGRGQQPEIDGGVVENPAQGVEGGGAEAMSRHAAPKFLNVDSHLLAVDDGLDVLLGICG